MIGAGDGDAFGAGVVERQVELADLAMPHARLQFELTTIDLGPTGSDQVDLLFSANPGSAPRSLGKVASGGEMSRVRLAVEVVLALLLCRSWFRGDRTAARPALVTPRTG